METSKIAILTTVANFELYQNTSPLFPKGIKKYVIDGRNGMHGIESIFYMMAKLKDKGIDWLIMADEDVIFYESDMVFDVITQMEQDNITVCGVRDGGIISHRNQNPYAINTFFSVLNFKDVLAIWNKKEVLKHQFITANEFADNLKTLPYAHDTNSLYEPYYCFYFWLRRQGKQFMFLDAKMDADGITNSVLYKEKVFLHHTWYARAYGSSKKHSQRIDIHLNKVATEEKNNFYEPPTIFKHKTFYIVKRLKKIYKLVRLKLNV